MSDADPRLPHARALFSDGAAVESNMRLTVVAQRSDQPTRRVFLHIYVYIPKFSSLISCPENPLLYFLYSFLQPADSFRLFLSRRSDDVFFIR
jgi:hypothetical protein